MKREKMKNYVLLVVICFCTIIVTIYFTNLIKTYKTSLLAVSPLNGNVREVSYAELEEAVAEAGGEIIYFGITNNKEVYKMEEKMLKNINKYEINDNFLYVNLGDNEEKSISVLRNKYDELKTVDFKAPLIMYYYEGEVLYIKYSNKEIINEKEIVNIVNNYDIEN